MGKKPLNKISTTHQVYEANKSRLWLTFSLCLLYPVKRLLSYQCPEREWGSVEKYASLTEPQSTEPGSLLIIVWVTSIMHTPLPPCLCLTPAPDLQQYHGHFRDRGPPYVVSLCERFINFPVITDWEVLLLYQLHLASNYGNFPFWAFWFFLLLLHKILYHSPLSISTCNIT